MHTITLSMDIEAPGVQVTPSVAVMTPLAGVVNRVCAVAAGSQHQGVEVTNRDLVDATHIEHF